MAKIVAVCVLLGVVAGIHAAHIGKRIVGGHDAQRHQFPYQAGLLLTGADGVPSFCGGSLISHEYILTAAHCFEGITTATVMLGAQYLNEKPDQIFVVQKSNFIIHPDWDMSLGRSDIALVKLPKSITFTIGEVDAAFLPHRSHTENFDDVLLTASGWGFTSDSSFDLSPVLRYTELPTLPIERCQAAYPGDVGEKNICIDASKGESTCTGDSGGPLVMHEKDGWRQTLVGIVSYGGERCEAGYPTVATKVSSYLDWISKETGIKIWD